MQSSLQLMEDTPQTLLRVKSHPSLAGDSAKRELPGAQMHNVCPQLKAGDLLGLS